MDPLAFLSGRGVLASTDGSLLVLKETRVFRTRVFTKRLLSSFPVSPWTGFEKCFHLFLSCWLRVSHVSSGCLGSAWVLLTQRPPCTPGSRGLAPLPRAAVARPTLCGRSPRHIINKSAFNARLPSEIKNKTVCYLYPRALRVWPTLFVCVDRPGVIRCA